MPPIAMLLPPLYGMATGAIVGSFIATLCIRWSRGEQASLGRSSCDGCSRVLGARDLVPVLSFIAARGQCRTCGMAIERSHLQVEVVAALVGGTALALSPSWDGAALALLGWLLLPSAILDARHFWLPDRLTLLIALGGAALGEFVSAAEPIDRILGGIAGFALLETIRRLYAGLRRREGLGAGDPKLLGAIGLWLGWANLPFVLLLASAGGLVVALLLRRGLMDRVPFGAAIAAAAWTCGAALVVLRAA